MGGVSQIDSVEREAAITAAIAMARDVIGDSRGGGMVPPSARLEALSDWQWRKLAEAVVSGWIIERSRQLTAERFACEDAFLAMGHEPEPASLGPCAAILRPLGDFVEKRGLSAKPSAPGAARTSCSSPGWTTDLVTWAETARDERPSETLPPNC